MKYLVDTNVLAELNDPGGHTHVRAWLRAISDDEICISVISIREIRKGIERQRARKPTIADQIDA